MSAPEPQVRVDGAWYMCDTCGAHMRPWNHGIPGAVENAARAHADACVPLQLARLQARWDARDEALRGLVRGFRKMCDGLERIEAEPQYRDGNHGFIAGTLAAADDLERAIGGGE